MSKLLVVLAVGLLLGADDKKDDAKFTKLRGVWTVVTSQKNGKEHENASDHALTFDGDTFTITRKGQPLLKGTFKVDETKKPKTIDMEIKEAPKEDQKDKMVLGIYELDGDNLKWCAADPGTLVRPKEFKAETGSECLLAILKREKK